MTRAELRAPDVVVVGAGASGCVLASRLIQSGASVELIESGIDPGPASALPQVLRDADAPVLTGQYDWGFRNALAKGRRSPLLPRGRVLGGSSATNSCVALRPEPTDFDAWALVADSSWSWDSVAPYFTRIESDIDFPTAPYHGSAGPVPVVRWRREELEAPSRAFLDSALAAGYPWCEDLNAPGATGVGLVPMNRRARVRVSAASAYLDPVRNHPNLRVRTSSTVTEVCIRRGRSRGLVIDGPQGRERIAAGQVVLCAGAYGTPWILLRSGVGPPGELRRAGIEVQVDLPGVGQELTDHSHVHLAGSWPGSDARRACVQTLGRLTSEDSAVRGDMQLWLLNYVEMASYAPGTVSAGWPVMLCASLQHAESRGSVCLSANGELRVAIDHLADRADTARYRAGVRSLWRIAGGMNDLSGLDIDQATIANDALLDHFISDRVQTSHHPMGTARMGASADPDSVVGADLAVHGVAGLHVADASIIPVCVRANIHLTCLVIGEIAGERLCHEVS
ncbi:MAG: hypothetical protein AUG48_03450 [Actinobacteria bacterium 13_1_20CM_3_68_9]|nr:MAG: hypothetical protein AUG48_03450 [Actinobacteria bacterium 13_1_20CM_3_68_9]